MGAALPGHSWPICGATDTRTGRPCEGLGDGFMGRCRWHGGTTLSPGNWRLLYLTTGIFIARSDGGLFRVSWKTAVSLIESGQVRRGSFYRREGQRLLQRIAAGPVEAKVVSEFFTTLREYRFEPRPAHG